MSTIFIKWDWPGHYGTNYVIFNYSKIVWLDYNTNKKTFSEWNGILVWDVYFNVQFHKSSGGKNILLSFS